MIKDVLFNNPRWAFARFFGSHFLVRSGKYNALGSRCCTIGCIIRCSGVLGESVLYHSLFGLLGRRRFPTTRYWPTSGLPTRTKPLARRTLPRGEPRDFGRC